MFERFNLNKVVDRTTAEAETKHKISMLLTPYIVRVDKWLEVYQGDTSHYEVLCDLLLIEAEENEIAEQHLYLNYDEFGKITLSLDEYGVFLFSHVLQEFLSLDEIMAMWKHLKSQNASVYVYRNLHTAFKKMNMDELKECHKNYQICPCDNESKKEIKQNILTLIDEAIKIKKGG